MDRNIKILFLFNFFTDFVFFAPVVIIYFAQVTGSYALGMSIFSLAYVASAIFEVPTGIISDLMGRKNTVISGALCSVICIVLYALGGSYLMLASGAIFQGLSRAFYSGNNDALLHDTLKESGKADEYHAYLGKVSSSFQIALALAMVAGSIMASYSFSLVMWVSVLPQLIALYLSTRFYESKVKGQESGNIYSHMKESINQFKVNKKLRHLTIASVLRFSLGESGFFLRSVFVNSLWPLWAVGISYFISNIFGAISFFFSGKLIDKYKPIRLLNFEVIFGRFVNLTALLIPNAFSPVLMASTSLTYGAGSVAVNSLQQKEFTDKQRATMSSLSSFAGNIAFGFFSVLMGIVADIYSPRSALIILNVLLFLVLYFYNKFQKLC